MLESITIRNYQAHERLSIEFDPLVTTLVGKSDVGKSSILRCLKWICSNRPAGTSFIKHGESFAFAKLVVDGQTIKRKRGAKENWYALGKQRYQALGHNVPQAIADLLNVDAINWQSQHSPHFLFSQTPGEVARSLNAVVNLGAIDATLARLAADVRQRQATVRIGEERLAKARQDRDRLSWIVEARQEFSAVERIGEEAASVAERASILASTLSAARIAERDRDRLSVAALDAGRAVSLVSEAVGLRQKTDRCRSILNEITRLRGEGACLRKEAEQAEAKVVAVLAGRCPLCKRI